MRFDGYEDRRLRLIAKETGPGSVLDIGYAQLPNRYLDPSLCTGFDIQKNINSPYKENIQGEVEKISEILDGKKFDNIVAAEFIEHLECPYKFLKDIKNIISRDGKIIISTPNPIAFPTLFFEWTSSNRFFYTNEHKYYFPPRWVKRILEHCGYDSIQKLAVGLWPTSIVPAPVALSYQVIYVAKNKHVL